MKHQTAIFALSIIFSFLWTLYYNNIDDPSLTYIIKPLKRIKWPQHLNEEETKQFIQEISNNRTAIVITDHPYFSNRKHPIWTPNDLIKYFDSSQHDININDIEYKSNIYCPIFEYYEQELPLIDIIKWEKPNNNTKLTTSLQQYWKYISKQTEFIKNNENLNNNNLYSCNSSYINNFQFRSFSTQILPTDNIINNMNINGMMYDKYLSQFIASKEELQTIKIWMGSRGTITRFHFDASNNFNIQIYGKKLFRLIKPKYHCNLYHFPWLHPQSRKSQIIKNGMLKYKLPHTVTTVTTLATEMYESVLNEGEIIYIPPIWDHEVIGISEEIININI